MTDREIMKQAIEALRQCEFSSPPAQRQIVKNAITALHEALAQPEQEPVAWMYPDNLGRMITTNSGKKPIIPRQSTAQPLYTAPPAAQPAKPLTPLTDEQIDSLVSRHCKKDSSHFDAARVARAIEAAHGIKEKS